MSEKKSKDKVLRICKTVMLIALLIIAFPFMLNKWFDVSSATGPLEGKVYATEFDNGSTDVARKLVCTFSDGMMHMYTYDITAFGGGMGGIRYDYQYTWRSYRHLLGGLYVSLYQPIVFGKL